MFSHKIKGKQEIKQIHMCDSYSPALSWGIAGLRIEKLTVKSPWFIYWDWHIN